jgi:hypothetical protein
VANFIPGLTARINGRFDYEAGLVIDLSSSCATLLWFVPYIRKFDGISLMYSESYFAQAPDGVLPVSALYHERGLAALDRQARRHQRRLVGVWAR